ncbi:MAG: hypothetical protein IT285_04750 [Bdellovibrionales bacterium]|nr:hypothetical protein [Bdellovibrionales bacterium]
MMVRPLVRSAALWWALTALSCVAAWAWMPGAGAPQGAVRGPAAGSSGGWLVTAEGTRIHPDCLSLAARRIADPALVKQRLRDWVSDAFAEITDCHGRYSALAPYLQQWRARARAMKVTCVDPADLADIDFAAISHGEDHFEIVRPTLFGILAGRGGSYTETYKTKEGKPATRGSTYSGVVHTFVHEVFHSTDANNRVDHNDIETLGPEEDGVCGSNVAMDRVCVLSSFCTDEWLTSSVERAQEVLFKRMTQCGRRRGCEDLFTGEAGNYGWWNHLTGSHSSDDLIPAKQAAQLCSQIKSEGYCEHMLDTQGPINTRANARLSAFQPMLLDRWGAVLPRAQNMVPKTLIDSQPGFRERLDAIAGSDCFKSLFRLNNLGELYAVHGKVPMVAIPSPFIHFGPGGPGSLSGHLSTLHSATQAAIPDRAACQGEEPRRQAAEILDWLWDLRDQVWGVDFHELYRASLSRAIHLPEPGYFLSGRPSVDDILKERLSRLLGRELLLQYERALLVGHHTSPAFSCSAAGLIYPSQQR